MSKIGDKVFYRGELTCPWWICFTFDNPVRALLQNPAGLISRFVKPGDKVLDIGPGRGYFTIPMSRIVGERGKVVGLDVQEKMLTLLEKNLTKRGCTNAVAELYDGTRFEIEYTFDFVLMFWMFHEVRNKGIFLKELKNVCAARTRLLLVEPIVHVTKRQFEAEIDLFRTEGFSLAGSVKIGLSRAIELAVGQENGGIGDLSL